MQQLRIRDELLGVERHEPLGRAERQGTEQDAADGAEDRGVRADPEREREDRNDREAGTSPEGPNRVPHIARECQHRSLHPGRGNG